MKIGDRVRNKYDGKIGTIVTILEGINQVIEVKFDKLEFVSVQTKKDVEVVA